MAFGSDLQYAPVWSSDNSSAGADMHAGPVMTAGYLMRFEMQVQADACLLLVQP